MASSVLFFLNEYETTCCSSDAKGKKQTNNLAILLQLFKEKDRTVFSGCFESKSVIKSD